MLRVTRKILHDALRAVHSHGGIPLIVSKRHGAANIFLLVRRRKAGARRQWKSNSAEFDVEMANGPNLNVGPNSQPQIAELGYAVVFFVGFDQPQLNLSASANQDATLHAVQLYITEFMQLQPALVVPAKRVGAKYETSGCAMHFKDEASAKQAHKFVLALARRLQQAVYFRIRAATLHPNALKVLTLESLTVSNQLSRLRFTQQVFVTAQAQKKSAQTT